MNALQIYMHPPVVLHHVVPYHSTLPKISGITFIRNGVHLGYPFLEVLETLSALYDEVIVAVGTSTDNTRQAIINATIPNLRIIDSPWDESIRFDGRELARQTMVALHNAQYEWCLYLQADEIIHEENYDFLHEEIDCADRDSHVEALLFRWLHFYGTYDYIGQGRQWYRREVRAFRNTGMVISWGDAQGFRTRDDRDRVHKLRARQTDIRIFHYGWVRHPQAMAQKYRTMQQLHHGAASENVNLPWQDFPYICYDLRRYTGSHPSVMQSRIERDRTWTCDFDPSRRPRKPILVAISDWLESHTG